jgi:hypothetical protein
MGLNTLFLISLVTISISFMELLALNFSEKFDFKCKKKEDHFFVFDIIRKQFYLLTPEEWVRQHVIHHLVYVKKIPRINIVVEKVVKINGMNKRVDICVYKKSEPFLLVECKAPNVKITQETFDQIMRYNLVLNTNILMITNGLQHIYAQLDRENKRYKFLTDFDF